MTSNVGNEFTEPSPNLQTIEGRDRMERGIKTHEEYVAKKKAEYDYFMANKRQIFAEKMEPRWAPTKNHGANLQDPVSDPNNLFKKSLEPLDSKPLQTEAFKRTTRQGGAFKAEQSSII